MPPHLRVPRWLTLVLALAILSGAAIGFLGESEAPAERSARTLFFASAFAYLTVSIVDFWEHFRLEKEVTGKVLAWKAVPPGETVNHACTVIVLLGMLLGVRRFGATLEARDWFSLVAPALFLALGWRDELVYHRRRAVHREDIMHTVAHLAAGVMIGSLYTMRLVGS